MTYTLATKCEAVDQVRGATRISLVRSTQERLIGLGKGNLIKNGLGTYLLKPGHPDGTGYRAFEQDRRSTTYIGVRGLALSTETGYTLVLLT